jgi:hypothetical protein
MPPWSGKLFSLPGVDAHPSQLQTSKFSMTSFYVTSFICSSVRATSTIFSMTNALVQASMLAFEQVHLS